MQIAQYIDWLAEIKSSIELHNKILNPNNINVFNVQFDVLETMRITTIFLERMYLFDSFSNRLKVWM